MIHLNSRILTKPTEIKIPKWKLAKVFQKNNTTEPKTSYANVTKQEFTPSQDQAIILQSIDGITIKEYAPAIANIIGPKTIKFLSKISNGRIYMYLDSKETVTSLTSKYKTVVVNNTNIEIRYRPNKLYCQISHL